MFKLLDDEVKQLNDEEETSDKDQFVKISQSVANVVRNSGSRFSIGIYGEWGTGKTTLMRLIEHHLNSFARDKITLSWDNLLQNNSSEFSKLKNFLNDHFKLSWLEDSELQYKESDEIITIVNKKIKNGKSPKYSQKKKVFSALSFLFNDSRSKTTYEVEKSIHSISIKLNNEKNKAILRVGDYINSLDVEKEKDGKIRLHLKENEILTVWFDAWRYEREENFALIALMKTIAYAMGDIPFYQDVKKILLRGLGIIGKDVLRHFATEYAMTNEGWTELNDKLLPRMDLLSKVDKDTIYFDGLQKIKEEMRKIINLYKIVIFIDDLDRCNSKKALEVFESTKAFLDIEGFIFIIGLSIDTLYKLVSKEYEGIGIKAQEYIRKIIQVYINLPVWDRTRIDKLVKDISHELKESDHELFRDTELIAKAANYNPREVKRLINRFTISSYLDEINPTIFLLIQAFENRWYDSLYKNLDDKGFRDNIVSIAKLSQLERDKVKKSYKEYEERIQRQKDPELTDEERALTDLYSTGFWDFVENIKYQSKIIEILIHWEEYKDKYGKSAEPTKDIKSVSNAIKFPYDIRKTRTGNFPIGDQRTL